MIETPHGDDPRGACRCIRSTARRASRPRRCCAALDAARHRPAGHRRAHLHLHLHDGQLPAGGGAARRAGHRLRPAESDRRRGRRGRAAAAGLRIVRRPVPDPDAPRDDDRRAGAAVQRRVRHRRASWKSSRMEGWTRDDVCATRPACRGSCRRRTCRRSTRRSSIRARCCSRERCSRRGAGTTRPFELVGAPWIDAERFAARDERLGLPRRLLPAGGLRADVPEAREAAVRRLPDPRHRSRRVQAGAGRRRADRHVPPRSTRPLRRGGSRRTNTSTTRCRSTSWRAPTRCGRQIEAGMPLRRDRGQLARDEDAFRQLRAPYRSLITVDAKPHLRTLANATRHRTAAACSRPRLRDPRRLHLLRVGGAR